MKAIIVEDEVLAKEELAYLIREHSDIEIVGSFEDGLDVLKFLQQQEVDAIFLDINIPSLDGVLLAQNISKFSRRPFIVFITAYKEHAAEAFEIEAFDYILKPYPESRIISMLSKLEAAYDRENRSSEARMTGRGATGSDGGSIPQTINLWKNEKIIVTDIQDIYYAAAQEKVTLVYTRKEQYTMPMSISEFHSRLPQDIFYRCHRSFSVNLTKIREIIPWFNNTYLLRLRDLENEVPVSRSKVKEFRQIMHL